MGLTRRSAAVNVLLLMDEHRRAAGARLSQLREQMEWSQERLAQEAGVSVKTVGRFERGQHDGRPHTVKALAKALKVDPEAITGPPPPPLGLGETKLDGRLDQMDERIDKLIELVEKLALTVAESVEDVAPQEKQSKRRSTSRKSASAKKRAGGA